MSYVLRASVNRPHYGRLDVEIDSRCPVHTNSINVSKCPFRSQLLGHFACYDYCRPASRNSIAACQPCCPVGQAADLSGTLIQLGTDCYDDM